MNINELITQHWHIDPVVFIIVLFLVGLQTWHNRKVPHARNVAFFSGIFLMLLVTFSPLAFLGGQYLFSAHMIEHIILLLIVPPLLLSGLNPRIIEYLKKSSFHRIGNVLFSAPVAWLMGMGAMYFWHIPFIFDVMKSSRLLHELHLISLLVLGTIFMWPVYAPLSWKKLEPLQGALYLFIACVGCTVLGILIVFSPPSMYVSFFSGHLSAVWELIRNDWGITPAIDQQAAGLIMWVPACFIYITNIMIILSQYFKQANNQSESVETI